MSTDDHALERHHRDDSEAIRNRDEFERFLDHAIGAGDDSGLSLRRWLDLAETWRITQALRETGGNRSAAARALGIGRRTLYAKMDKLQIAPTWGVGEPSR